MMFHIGARDPSQMGEIKSMQLSLSLVRNKHDSGRFFYQGTRSLFYSNWVLLTTIKSYHDVDKN
jgi:hypothetical protein